MYAFAYSTVPLPKDASYFKSERRKVVERLLTVSTTVGSFATLHDVGDHYTNGFNVKYS